MLVGQKVAALATAAAQAVLNAAWTIGISLLITGLITAISNLINRKKELREETLRNAEAATEYSNQVKSLADRYLELSAAVGTDEGAKTSLMETQQELISLLGIEDKAIKSLIETYGSLDKAILAMSRDALTDTIRDLTAGITAKETEVVKAGKGGFFDGNIISASGNNVVNSFKLLEQGGLVNSGNYGSLGGTIVLSDGTTLEKVLNNYEKLDEIRKYLLDNMSIEELSDNSLFELVEGKFNSFKGVVDEYKEMIDSLNSTIATREIYDHMIDSPLPETQQEFEEYRDRLAEVFKCRESAVRKALKRLGITRKKRRNATGSKTLPK